MARTVNEILAQMTATKATKTELDPINSPSQTSRWNLFLYIVAVGIAAFEQVLDIRNLAVELLVAASKPSTTAYIKYRCINLFQYDATTPQVLITSGFFPTYATIDATKRIITRCAVTTISPGVIQVKVAKGTTSPVPLSAPELSAFSDFLDEILPAGMNYFIISSDSDKIYVAADIMYKGSFSPVIALAVKQALADFYATLSSDINFNGVMLVSDIENAIKNLEINGVKAVDDVIMRKVYAREDTAPFVDSTKIMDLSLAVNIGSYQMYAGYGEEENTVGYTLDDSLNFIVSG